MTREQAIEQAVRRITNADFRRVVAAIPLYIRFSEMEAIWPDTLAAIRREFAFITYYNARRPAP